MKFKHEYMSEGQIGDLFGVKSSKVQKWLQRTGLLDKDFRLTSRAVKEKFVEAYSRLTCSYLWHVEKTVFELERKGKKRIPNPPENLVKHRIISGPLGIRKNNSNGYDLTNRDGTVSMMVLGKENAEYVLKLLNEFYGCFDEPPIGYFE